MEQPRDHVSHSIRLGFAIPFGDMLLLFPGIHGCHKAASLQHFYLSSASVKTYYSTPPENKQKQLTAQ